MINAAVIGTGYIGPLTIEALRRLGYVKVAGVCDANMALAQRIAARYSINKVYAHWQDAVGDKSIKVVHICSPNNLHYEMNKAVIQAGKHVLSEKPLAISQAEAEELAMLAGKTGIITGVNFCYRYYPLVLEMASRILTGFHVPRIGPGDWNAVNQGPPTPPPTWEATGLTWFSSLPD